MPNDNDTDLDPCVACADTKAKTISAGAFDGIHQDCPRCSEFKLSRTVLSMMSNGVGKEKRAKLSGWIRDQNCVGAIPMITSDIFTKIIDRPLPTVAERTGNKPTIRGCSIFSSYVSKGILRGEYEVRKGNAVAI